MKKVLIILLMLFLHASCEKKEPNFSEEMIHKLSIKENKDKTIPPSIYTFLDLYILTSDNEIHVTNNHELLLFYKKYYYKKFKYFEEFLDAVLNKEFILNKEKFKNSAIHDSFKLNSKIIKEYSSLKFTKFFKKYTKQITQENIILNTPNLKEDEYLTIVYIFYKNRYDKSSDCYLGVDYIRKREDVIK